MGRSVISTTKPIIDQKNLDKNIPVNNRNNLFIISNPENDLPVIVLASESHQANNEPFDPNHYDRVLQYETTLNKSVEPFGRTQPLLSSIITPGEGFSDSDTEAFKFQLRKIRQDMDQVVAEEQYEQALLSGLTFSVTTGILIWSLLASSLLLTLMSMLPLWRGIDPLPILEEVKKRKPTLEEQRKDKKAEDKNAKTLAT